MLDARREKIIEKLIQDRIGDWVHAHNTDSLEIWLMFGFKGFDDLSDQELEDAIDALPDAEEFRKELEIEEDGYGSKLN